MGRNGNSLMDYYYYLFLLTCTEHLLCPHALSHLLSHLWGEYCPLRKPSRATSLQKEISFYEGHMVLFLAILTWYADAPLLTKVFCQDKPIISWKHCKSKVQVIHLTYRTSQLSLACLTRAQNTSRSLQLGNYREFHFKCRCLLLLTRTSIS